MKKYCKCIFMQAPPSNLSKGSVSRALNFLRSLITGIPYYEKNSFSLEADAWLRQETGEQEFDVIEADISASVYLKMPQAGFKSWIMHSITDSNEKRKLNHVPGMINRLRIYGYWWVMRRYERTLFRDVDLCVTLTPENEFDLRQRNPNLPVSNCLSNGVALDYFNYQPPEPVAAGVCFVGKLDYFPNEDAVLYFYHQIFPLIKQAHPTVRFFVVGSSPGERLQALARDPSVEVTGFVEDVRPYLRKAGIAVIPVRMGGGILNKVLEAMAMGVPVITRTLGTHGLKVEPGRDLLVCDKEEEFACEVNRLLGDQHARHELAKNGRRYVENNHEWCAIIKQYESELVSRIAAKSKAFPFPETVQ